MQVQEGFSVQPGNRSYNEQAFSRGLVINGENFNSLFILATGHSARIFTRYYRIMK